MALQYLPALLPQAGSAVSVPDPTDAATPNKLAAVPAYTRVDQTGAATPTGAVTDPTSTTSRGGTGLATNQVAVGTSATLIAAARAGRQKIIITSTAATVFYVGPSGVTTGNGLYVAGAAGASVTLDTAAAVYAVGASAVTVSYAELY